MRGVQIVDLCLSAHVLAEAGLLSGRRTTRHWEFAEAMADRFPVVDIEPDVQYLEDRNVLTSAATAAGIDACLRMACKRLGVRAANRLNRRLVVPPHREGRQAQLIQQQLPNTTGETRLTRLIDSVRTRLDQRLRVEVACLKKLQALIRADGEV